MFAPRSSMSSCPAISTDNVPLPLPLLYNIPSPSLHSPAPFDWLHFDDLSVPPSSPTSSA
ncbi:hypothetical protein JVT61DRAFT_12598 [Boletus reticuloceps]|uniref:Uncharacterized protein n=1 Tax=Boletus reticuloceps TaxID=495285 RepID=A0A8I3A4M6_9AGAM|nr:hypothetical protein JVT61DRAFT_12598 [Boletus reticuloceps]